MVSNEDDLQRKTTENGRWPQNMKSRISQQPLVRSYSNLKLKLMGLNFHKVRTIPSTKSWVGLFLLLLEPKTLWVLGMPLLLTSCCCFVVLLLSTTITLGFRLDHRLVTLGRCRCYRGKVKSTPSFRLGWEFDNNDTSLRCNVAVKVEETLGLRPRVLSI